MTKETTWKPTGCYTIGPTRVQVFKAAERVGCIKEIRLINGTERATYYNCPIGLKTDVEEEFLRSL